MHNTRFDETQTVCMLGVARANHVQEHSRRVYLDLGITVSPRPRILRLPWGAAIWVSTPNPEADKLLEKNNCRELDMKIVKIGWMMRSLRFFADECKGSIAQTLCLYIHDRRGVHFPYRLSTRLTASKHHLVTQAPADYVLVRQSLHTEQVLIHSVSQTIYVPYLHWPPNPAR